MTKRPWTFYSEEAKAEKAMRHRMTHIPDEVVEAVAAVLLSRVNAPENQVYAAARAAITAALEVWPWTGMAKSTAVWQLGDGTWSFDSGAVVENENEFNGIIIRTEEPK